MRMLLAASALLFAAAPGTAIEQDKRNQVPAATPAGEPVDCLRLRDIRQSKVRDDSTIDFYTIGGKVYRNTLDGSCPMLGSEKRFAHKTSGAELCSIDLITVLQEPNLSRGASCGLGKFQPMTLARQ
jgi:hypothetical protein